MTHLVHLTIFGFFLLGAVVVWFWDEVRQKRFELSSLLILIAAFLIIAHTSLGAHFAYHHQARDPYSYHPCCAPQTADISPPILVIPPIGNLGYIVVYSPKITVKPLSSPINNRSPPSI